MAWKESNLKNSENDDSFGSLEKILAKLLPMQCRRH
jgi:hypothetical protein